MISKKSYTPDWLNKRKFEIKKDPALIEKVIMALTLLEKLKLEGLNFLFKGGTALVLLLKNLNRISIDIDIIMKEKSKELELILSKVIDGNTFIKFEEDKRINSKIPKQHYKFFYKSQVSSEEEGILLDILYGDNPYNKTTKVPIASDFIINESPEVLVECPDINSILGDKLTAFAPNTTGIKYKVKKELEIIKQLYDIGKLFDMSDDLASVIKSFNLTAKYEIRFRGLDISSELILDDIMETAAILSFRGLKEKDKFDELASGLKRITSFVFLEPFRIEMAVLAASKAAYLSRLIKKEIQDIERFDKSIDISKHLITNIEYSKFNKLKELQPAAVFYWSKAIELL